MTFLKNLSSFLDECRLYNRKCFTGYQWEYIKKILESHQYMMEFLGEFGGAFFDRLYDASVLHHEGLINHTHDKRYNSQKMIVLGTIKTLIQQRAGLESEWSFDQNLLASGYYREVLLNWAEVESEEGLRDYINFLFDEFDKGGSTTAYWVIALAVWGGQAVPKEPFLAALHDSQKAYDPRSGQSAYENQTYSCMIGLEDRISHFYSYLYSKEELPIEQQSLACRYIHATFRPFIEPCSEHGYKPSPLLYGLYLKARFGSYTISDEQTHVRFLKITAEHYDVLKNNYVENQLISLKDTIIRRFGDFEGVILRFINCRDKELLPFYDIFLRLQNEDGLIILKEEQIKVELSEKFDTECQAFRDEVVVDDYIAMKVRSFFLERCLFFREAVSKTLILPEGAHMISMTVDEVCLRLEQSTCLTRDWLDALQYFPAVNLFALLECWVEKQQANALPLELLDDELEKNLTEIESLEIKFFNNSLNKMSIGELSYAEYCYVSHGLLNEVHYQLFINESSSGAYHINMRQALENGSIIFAQDSLLAKYLDEWLSIAGMRLRSVFDADEEDAQHVYTTTIAENLNFVARLIELGFDQTVHKLMLSSRELVSDLILIPFPDNLTEREFSVLESLANSPMPNSVDCYFNQGGQLWGGLLGNDNCQDAFYYGLYQSNLIFLNQCIQHSSVEKILENQQAHKIKRLIEAVVQARDAGVWAWFDSYFFPYYDVIEKIQPIRMHPVLLTLKLPNLRWADINFILKRFPNFLKKFIEEKSTHYSDRGVEIFFDVFPEPLSYSIAHAPQAVSLLITYPSYQKYLFEKRSFLIINYIQQALKHRHIEAANMLVDELAEHISEEQLNGSFIYRPVIKRMVDIFNKEIIGLINATLYKKNTVSLKMLQKLHTTVESITASYSFKNWIEEMLIVIGADMTPLKNKLDVLQLKNNSLFLQKAINLLWLKAQSCKKDNIRILQLTALLRYGYWPEGVAKNIIIKKLLSIQSSKNLIDVLDLCQSSEPSLMVEVLECLSDNSYFNFNFLEKALAKSLVEKRLDLATFYQMSALLEEYSHTKNYSRVLISYGWAYLWNLHKHKEPPAISLLSSILKIESADAHSVAEDISNLATTEEVKFWNILRSYEGLPSEGIIWLLFGVKKINKTLPPKNKPNVLIEAIGLRQFDFASYYVEKYPDLSNAQHKSQSPFNHFMLSFDVAIVTWVLSTPQYHEALAETWVTHTKRALIQEFLDISEALLSYALQNGWFTSDAAFELWSACGAHDKKSSAEFLERFLCRYCSPSVKASFERQQTDSPRSRRGPLFFSNHTQRNSAPTNKKRRGNSKEYIDA